MSAQVQGVLCRYHYDALDRLIGISPERNVGLQRFYCKNRLATEIQGVVQRSIFQQNEQLFAQQDRYGDAVETSLLATDQMRSVLQIVKANRPRPIAYSPYGRRTAGGGLLSLLGFNGEQLDSVTGYYLLGNGYRAFNPTLMRFNSPDNMSPFGKGGVNPYAYCLGDPVNYSDESGHISFWRISAFLSRNKKMPSFSLPASPASEKYKLYSLVLDENVPKKAVINSYKKAIYSAGAKHRIPIPIRKVTSLEQLHVVQRWPRSFKFDPYVANGSNRVSFIYTKHKELFVGSQGHLSLSVLAKSDKVISAGELIRLNDNSFSISNKSGHFKPDLASLVPVKRRLEKLGANTIELTDHKFV